QAAKIADAIVIGVVKRAHVELVDDGVLVPVLAARARISRRSCLRFAALRHGSNVLIYDNAAARNRNDAAKPPVPAPHLCHPLDVDQPRRAAGGGCSSDRAIIGPAEPQETPMPDNGPATITVIRETERPIVDFVGGATY